MTFFRKAGKMTEQHQTGEKADVQRVCSAAAVGGDLVMASSKDYLHFILEQLSDLDAITHRTMMGEYILYNRGKLTAYICDDRLLVKPVKSALALMPDASYVCPYEGAKELLLVENVDDSAFLTELFASMYEELPFPKKKK